MKEERIDELKRIAYEADKKELGQWTADLDWQSARRYSAWACCREHTAGSLTEALALIKIDLDFVAAFDPSTCLRLLGEIERLRHAAIGGADAKKALRKIRKFTTVQEPDNTEWALEQIRKVCNEFLGDDWE